MDSAETKTIGKYRIDVVYDESPINPREDDNLGTMVCFNSRYNLGDKHNYTKSNYNSWEELEADIIKTEKVGVILPLMIYDHSGITMYIGTSGDRWDSSRVGFIFISKKKMCEEYGYKRVSKKLIERVTKYLHSEVETYDSYIKGECYGYRITDTEKDELVESCWGYYDEDYCMSEAEYLVKNMTE